MPTTLVRSWQISSTAHTKIVTDMADSLSRNATADKCQFLLFNKALDYTWLVARIGLYN